MNTMKNAIALGLMACAAFANVARADEVSDQGVKFMAEFACVDGPMDAMLSQLSTQLSGRQYVSEEKYHEALSQKDIIFAEKVVNSCAQDFINAGLAKYIPESDYISRSISDLAINNNPTILAWKEEQAKKYKPVMAAEIQKILDNADADLASAEAKWKEQYAKDQAEANRRTEAKAARQAKVAQVASQAAQVDCTDWQSQFEILRIQRENAWQVLMQQRRDLKAQLDGVYSPREVNAMIQDNTAGLQRDAEMASDNESAYFKQCGK